MTCKSNLLQDIGSSGERIIEIESVRISEEEKCNQIDSVKTKGKGDFVFISLPRSIAFPSSDMKQTLRIIKLNEKGNRKARGRDRPREKKRNREINNNDCRTLSNERFTKSNESTLSSIALRPLFIL